MNLATRSLLLTAAVLLLCAGLAYVYYFNVMEQESHTMNTGENMTLATIDGVTYTREATTVNEANVPPTVIVAQSATGETAVAADETASVELTSLADIYTHFPFLREPTLEPEAALLHAELVMALQGDIYTVITADPDQETIVAWQAMFDAKDAERTQRFYDGPDAKPIPETSGAGDIAPVTPPDFSRVHAPRQSDNLLTFFVTMDKRYPLPVRVMYHAGGSVSLQHSW